MTERNANRPSLSRLYRRFAGSQTAPLPQAEDLLALARLPHADDAAAPVVADLLRLARELEPASAELSQDLRAAFEQTSTPAHRRAAPRRVAAHGARRWRGVAAIAASLLAVAGVWTLQRGAIAPPAKPVAANALPDRIFASGTEVRAVTAQTDVIFRDQFSAQPQADAIFRSTFNG